MSQFDVRSGMRVDEVIEKISYKKSKLLEKHISFITQKRIKAINCFAKDFHKLLKKLFYGKTKENICIKVEVIKEEDKAKSIRQ